MEKYSRVEEATENKRRKRISRSVPKATNTLSEFVIHIAFPQQQWLHERASLLLYTYTACLVSFITLPKISQTSEWDQQLCLETNICGKKIMRTLEQSKKVTDLSAVS